jgi:hypothetical protein
MSTSAPANNVEGWTPQFTIEIERAQEYTDLYRALGNEVRTEAVDPKRMQDEECSACLMAGCDRYVMIYTRPRNPEVQA